MLSSDTIGWAVDISGWIFIPSALILLVTVLTLLASGNMLMFGRGQGMSQFFVVYIRSAAKGTLLAQLVVLCLGIALEVYVYSIHAANIDFRRAHGSYEILTDSGTVVSFGRWTQLLIANHQFSWIGISVIILSFAVALLEAERTRLRPAVTEMPHAIRSATL